MSPRSSSGYATPLVLEPRPSRWLLGPVFAGHAAIMLLLPFTTLPTGLWLLAEGLVGWSLWRIDRCHRRQDCDHSVIRLEWRRGNSWLVGQADGTTWMAELGPGTLLTPYLVGLDLRLDTGRRIDVILPPDALPADAFRRLKVRLRIEGRGRREGP